MAFRCCLLFFLSSLLCSLHGNPTGRADDTLPAVRVECQPGVWVRPGAWVWCSVWLDPSRIEWPASETVCTPVVELRDTAGRLAWQCILPSRTFSTGSAPLRLGAPLLAGEAALRLSLSLRAGTTECFRWNAPQDEMPHTLARDERLAYALHSSPMAANGLRFSPLSTNHFPREAGYLESASLLVLGDMPAVLEPSQWQALMEWCLSGGLVVVADSKWNAPFAKTCSRFSIPSGGWAPLVLPEKLSPPRVQRMGRGLWIDLSASSLGAELLQKPLFWARIHQEWPVLPVADLRLAPARYDALSSGWPPPPRVSTAVLGRFVLVWLLLLGAAACLPWVRASRKRVAVVFASLASLGLVLVWRLVPPPQATVRHALVRIAGEAGPSGPTLDEDVWAVSSFGGEALSLLLDSSLPPRVLAATEGELSRTCITLDLSHSPARLLIGARDAQAPLVAHGSPLLLSRRTIGRGLTPALRMVRESNGMLELVPARKPFVLHDVQLETREAIYSVPLCTQKTPAVSIREDGGHRHAGRRALMQMLRAEHAPGDYAVLMGWQESVPADESLGTLLLYGVSRLDLEATP